jgi:cytoskeletal protein CcmA (bactofilin family)
MSILGGDPARRDPRPSRTQGDRPLEQENAYQNDGNGGLNGLRNVLGGRGPQGAHTGPTPPDKCENVLASGAKWEGTLTVDTSVRIDGVFSGKIVSQATVHVADGAHVNAAIHAAYVAIAGDFKGEIRAEQRTDLLPRGRIQADVITGLLVVQEGGIFDGHVQMALSGNQRQAPRSEPMDAPPPERRQERQQAAVASSANNHESN